MRLIEVKVNGLFLTQNQASGIILKEIEGERALPIIIGEYEAQSIALGLENIQPPRPITHDLMANLLDVFNIRLNSVIVTDLRNNTYYAILKLESMGEMIEVDSRPSDAIALAVRKNVPIYVNEEVMIRASIFDNEIDREKEEEPEPENFLQPDKEEFQQPLNMLERLKKELDEAIAREEYEKAAKIRDEIKRLESSQH